MQKDFIFGQRTFEECNLDLTQLQKGYSIELWRIFGKFEDADAFKVLESCYISKIFQAVLFSHRKDQLKNDECALSLSYFKRIFENYSSIRQSIISERMPFDTLIKGIINRRLHLENCVFVNNKHVFQCYTQRVKACIPPQPNPKCLQRSKLPLRNTQSVINSVVKIHSKCKRCNLMGRDEWYPSINCQIHREFILHIFCAPVDIFEYVEPLYSSDWNDRDYDYSNLHFKLCPMCNLVDYNDYPNDAWQYEFDLYDDNTNEVTHHLLRHKELAKWTKISISSVNLNLEQRVGRFLEYLFDPSDLNHDQWFDSSQQIDLKSEAFKQSIQVAQELKEYVNKNYPKQARIYTDDGDYNADGSNFCLSTNTPQWQGNQLKCGGDTDFGLLSSNEYHSGGIVCAGKCFKKFDIVKKWMFKLYEPNSKLAKHYDHIAWRVKAWFGFVQYANPRTGPHKMMKDCPSGQDQQFYSYINLGMKDSNEFNKISHIDPILVSGNPIESDETPYELRLFFRLVTLRQCALYGADWQSKFFPEQMQINGYHHNSGIRSHFDHLSWFNNVDLFKLFAASSLHFGVKTRDQLALNETYLFPLEEGTMFRMRRYMNTYYPHQVVTWGHHLAGITALFRSINKREARIYQMPQFEHPCRKKMSQAEFDKLSKSFPKELSKKEKKRLYSKK